MSAQHQSQKQQNLGREEADAVVMCCKTARPPAVSHSEAVNVSATLQPPAAPGDDAGPLFPPLSRSLLSSFSWSDESTSRQETMNQELTKLHLVLRERVSLNVPLFYFNKDYFTFFSSSFSVALNPCNCR